MTQNLPGSRIGRTHSCASPSCSAFIPSNMVACRPCWDTVPANLQDAFYRSCCGKPGRRAAWKRVERYLAIRESFREQAAL